MATVKATFELDETIKRQAEDILQRLGIPASVLVDSLYRQVIMKGGVPFSVTMPERPKAFDELTEEEFMARIDESIEQMKRGEGIPIDEAFADIRRRIGI